ncbi:hypothetical protein PF008_g4582 [Phytophthora fragariae]|uniref:Uncharacterized protein n=1 Tax=Phytophthora fragariae TaxID=53985 RepID=A0A6G0SCJ3_9STRA|nr:hypothetical protein PF008_g4582 [Phytophthora fragariae]
MGTPTLDAEEEHSGSTVRSEEISEDPDAHVELDDAVSENIDMVLGVQCCEKRCIKNRAEATTTFLTGCMKMSKDCPRPSFITALATCSGLSEGSQRHRFTGARTRYSHRNQVKRGEFALPAHINTGNMHAQFVDVEAMIAFLSRLAETQPDVVPVRFRYQKSENGTTSRPSTTKEYQLLPVYFTWVVVMLGCVEETAELWTSLHDINTKVLQYVPPDLRSDPLYIEEAVAATKRYRRQRHCRVRSVE